MFLRFSDDARALLTLVSEAAKERGGEQIEVDDFRQAIVDYDQSKDN